MNRAIRLVHVTSDFKKAFQKLPLHIQDLAIKKDRSFRENAFTKSLRTHKLKGPLDGYWSYSVNIDYRILLRFINAHEVIYYDIGTHGIYGK